MSCSKERKSLTMVVLITSSIVIITGITLGTFARGSLAEVQEEAMLVQVNTVYARSFEAGDLEDWWKIQLFPGETCKIYLNVPTPGLVADLKAYNESLGYFPKNGTMPWGTSGTSWYGCIFYGFVNNASQSQWFYINITRISGTGNYQLFVEGLSALREQEMMQQFTFALGILIICCVGVLAANFYAKRWRRNVIKTQSISPTARVRLMGMIKLDKQIDLRKASTVLNFSAIKIKQFLQKLEQEGKVRGKFKKGTFLPISDIANFIEVIDKSFAEWDGIVTARRGKQL